MGIFGRSRKRPIPPPDDEPEDDNPESTVSKFLSGETGEVEKSVEELLDELVQIAKRVASVRGPEDLEALFTYIVDASVKRTQAERGILIIESKDGTLQAEIARASGGTESEEQVFSRSAARKVLANNEPLLDEFSAEEESREIGASIIGLRLRALMAVPLTIGRTSEDRFLRRVLYVDSRERSFDERDLSYFVLLSQQIASAIEIARLHVDSLERVRLEQSIELASAIQRGFMARRPECPPGFEISGWYEPAELASGDFYSFVRTRSGAIGAVVGDAAGHGVGPALVAASTQGGLKSLLRVVDDPAEALTTVNRDLAIELEDDLFLTLCLVVVELDGTLRAYNAGHPSPLWYSAANDKVVELPGGGLALGIEDGYVYTPGRPFCLEEGDALLIYTDGLTEARSATHPDRRLGVGGLADILYASAVAATNAEELTQAVARGAHEFTRGKREDDMTVVVVRRSAVG